MILLLKPAATAAVSGLLAMSSYITYSVRTKKHIEQNIIPPMEVLAAYQQQQLPKSSSSSSSSTTSTSGLGGTDFIKNELVLGTGGERIVDSGVDRDETSTRTVTTNKDDNSPIPTGRSKFPIDLLPFLLQDDDGNTIINPNSSSRSSSASDWIWIAGDEHLAIPTANANIKTVDFGDGNDVDKKRQHQQEEQQTPIFRSTPSGDFACLISPDGQSSALFGRQKRTVTTTTTTTTTTSAAALAEMAESSRGRERNRKTLRDLVKQKTKYLTIDSDIFDRADWNYNINQCQDVVSTVVNDGSSSASFSGVAIENIIDDGPYRFCYRDYVNHEETFGLLCQRWTLIRFLFRPTLAEELVISTTTNNNNNNGVNSERLCSLNGNGRMFGFIPIRTRWDGRLAKTYLSDNDSNNSSKALVASIEWDRTEIKMGWKRFGTTIDRPAVAEKLRIDPWRIKLPSDDDDIDDNFSSGDILCLLREGKGHLIFARDRCLSERPSLRKRVRRRLSRLFRRRTERKQDEEQGTATAVA